MPENSLILVDSNILVYAYDINEKGKRPKALKIIQSCWEGKLKLCVSAQNLSESFFILTNKVQYPLSVAEAGERVQAIINSSKWKVFDITKEAVSNAMVLSKNHGMVYWDSLIASVMKLNGVSTIYTENTKDFSKLPGIEVVNPLR
ncbi:MAG: PIN domain-containing protein [Candidatus Aenigmarchaeota archaeon]|nr:PIN domain-containing protein [Candidatus Aenigmarchaeota archaeon]